MTSLLICVTYNSFDFSHVAEVDVVVIAFCACEVQIWISFFVCTVIVSTFYRHFTS